ncbi:hypothetical protein A3C59_04615 [Candidatus Daviesbacteria bacterium RIFCSPHIGHO2_02_FULL_36_13]|uniref:Type II secretion system protein GspG C-terminal domain-containing protein n=1 Tax=Candidatus Daviesbacteria bacterium RIFCSPHIGHO2_02_FULL_36_13 TaxID=1797768 RepID=A0A1F5JUE6_9BACT|nr:MAG: hypothetical protein A3C59_04615 [Candidatus Daviesbacteria bacterium RIFCSPHIGHO2_02_FULL_36_13]OGE43669.1 MAG: hypothetical protein A3A45_02005 [Candidatus Daviesbacteria bacterium RIFCSPLOWO2_01_FULL_36_8]
MRKFLPKTLNNPSGFTLIELLVVISIIAILSVLGISLFGGVQKKARDTERISEINAIKDALEQRFDAASGTYPGPLQATWFANGVIPEDPTEDGDPLTADDYTGVPTAPATGFTICATLEANTTPSCVYNQQQ